MFTTSRSLIRYKVRSNPRNLLLAHYSMAGRETASLVDLFEIDEARAEVAALPNDFYEQAAKLVVGGIRRIITMFKIPRLVLKLKAWLGEEITLDGFKEFLKRGAWQKQQLAKYLTSRAWWVVKEGQVPTIITLLEQVEEKNNVQGAYHEKVVPIDVIKSWFALTPPEINRSGLASLFAYLWFNCEELNWKPDELIAGFSGSVSLDKLIGSLSETALNVLIGYIMKDEGRKLMPLILIARVSYMLNNGYLVRKDGCLQST